LLVLGCAHLFEVWPSSSCQQGLVGDAIANPSRIFTMWKTHFSNGHRSPLVTGKAPIIDHVLQMSQER
jgi:hypothetical protein